MDLGPCHLPDDISQVNYLSTGLTVHLGYVAVVMVHRDTTWGGAVWPGDPHVTVNMFGAQGEEGRAHLYVYSDNSYRGHRVVVGNRGATRWFFALHLSSPNYQSPPPYLLPLPSP